MTKAQTAKESNCAIASAPVWYTASVSRPARGCLFGHHDRPPTGSSNDRASTFPNAERGPVSIGEGRSCRRPSRGGMPDEHEDEQHAADRPAAEAEGSRREPGDGDAASYEHTGKDRELPPEPPLVPARASKCSALVSRAPTRSRFALQSCEVEQRVGRRSAFDRAGPERDPPPQPAKDVAGPCRNPDRANSRISVLRGGKRLAAPPGLGADASCTHHARSITGTSGPAARMSATAP